MMHDPTAKAAAANVDGAQVAAILTFRNTDNQPEQRYLDVVTLATLGRLVRGFRDDHGRIHVRFKEEAAALLEQSDGQAPTRGTNS